MAVHACGACFGELLGLSPAEKGMCSKQYLLEEKYYAPVSIKSH